MAIDDGDQGRVTRNFGDQALDMAFHLRVAGFAGTLRAVPARMQPISGGDREQADTATILGHQAHGFDRLRRDHTGIDDDDLRIRAGPAQPIAAVDDVAGEIVADRRCGCSSCGSRAGDRRSRPPRRPPGRSARLLLSRHRAADGRSPSA